jgi:allophanate hydrolase subunit 2
VTAQSNRIALRLEGPALQWRTAGELLSEGVVLGSIQVPPDGQPVLFLADHPATGGYPVVGVVPTPDIWLCGQARPGTLIRLHTKHPAVSLSTLKT